jgi:hypothetical protein
MIYFSEQIFIGNKKIKTNEICKMWNYAFACEQMEFSVFIFIR